MIRKPFIGIIAFFFVLSAQGQADLCLHLGRDENLNYKAYYNAGFVRIYGGDVTFTSHRRTGRVSPYLELRSTGKTRPKYRWFYRIDDRYTARYQCSGKTTVFFEQHTLEGNKERHWQYRFNSEKHSIRIIDKLTGDSSLLKEPDFPVDILTAVYLCRFLPFDTCTGPGQFRLRTLLNDSVQNLVITFHRRMFVPVYRSQPVDVYFFSARIPGGTLFKKDRELNVYVTADLKRIPVLVEAPVTIGWVKAVYQGGK